MNAEVLNLDQRRQAIQRGLQHYFQGNHLEQIVGYWEQEYSEQPAFVLNRFLSEICTTEELKQNRKDMLKQVLHELTILEKSGWAASKDEEAVSLNQMAQYRAYMEFGESVLGQVQLDDQKDFHMELGQQLVCDQILLQETCQKLWKSVDLLSHVSSKNYARAITSLYQVFCDFYGPQRSDQVYAQAKNLIKQKYPEANLQQLL
ncbi:hypothetical protein BS636_02650 [Acinetobacter sp. LoGeW2-3]|uniref:hypothetical protein n=1 Tax=Acinetobacter sp. LoGeW2-3 TaxID=1808001 RepID=UPI000C05CB9D|nr:hypothetical protein [Acinetobacter sp. LoGeW2-3]ATO18637.1 hypothetical protein BS636_02650 [Acinetobacter sp. LoGeW2-3]